MGNVTIFSFLTKQENPFLRKFAILEERAKGTGLAWVLLQKDPKRSLHFENWIEYTEKVERDGEAKEEASPAFPLRRSWRIGTQSRCSVRPHSVTIN